MEITKFTGFKRKICELLNKPFFIRKLKLSNLTVISVIL